MKKTLASRALMCREDFLAMSVSMAEIAASLRRRFNVRVMLESGHAVAAAQRDAYDRKFAEYLERSKARWLKQEAQLGRRHADYDSFLKLVPSKKRADVENRTSIRAWSAASGPFLEALCLLADVAKTTSARYCYASSDSSALCSKWTYRGGNGWQAPVHLGAAHYRGSSKSAKRMPGHSRYESADNEARGYCRNP